MDALELQEFFIEGGDQRRSHVLLHITEPSTPEEEKKGYFFALAELENATIEHISALQQVIDDLESGYYATEDDKQESAFELTLEYINRRAANILDKTVRLHFFVGVFRGHDLLFAHHGDMSALLLHSQGESTQMMDLLDGADKPEPGQLFSSVVQGTLNRGDFFYIGTPHITQYFSDDRVQKIVSSRSLKQSTEHIEKVLHDLQADESFGGIVFRMLAKKKRPPAQKKKEVGSAASLDHLLSARKATAETLAPPLMKGLMKKAREHKRERAEAPKEKKKQRGKVETNYRYREQAGRRPDQSLMNVILIGLGRALVAAGLGLYKFVRKTGVLIGKFLVATFILTTNKNNSRQDVMKTLRKYRDDKRRMFEDLPLLSKILFLATIAFAVVFIGSIGAIRVREHYQAKRIAQANLIQGIIDKKDAAEAKLIYDDQESAFVLLKEAQQLLDEFPADKKSQREQKAQLTEEIEKLMMMLRKIDVVSPTLLVDLNESGANTTGLARIDDTLIAFGPDDTKTYRWDMRASRLHTQDHLDTIHLNQASTPKEEDIIAFIDGEDRVAWYDKQTQSIQAKDISFHNNDVSIGDAVVYNVRLYTVDTKNNQIYKHGRTQTGFDRGSAWLKEDHDLSDATGITIDGDVFVLKANGQLLKFEKGGLTTFELTGVDPALENPVDVQTYNDLSYIYILEPTHKRIVVVNKEGKMIKQITADEWQNPTSMIVDEPNNKIYVLDSNKMYELSIFSD